NGEGVGSPIKIHPRPLSSLSSCCRKHHVVHVRQTRDGTVSLSCLTSLAMCSVMPIDGSNILDERIYFTRSCLLCRPGSPASSCGPTGPGSDTGHAIAWPAGARTERRTHAQHPCATVASSDSVRSLLCDAGSRGRREPFQQQF